jgi:hypothetical protein
MTSKMSWRGGRPGGRRWGLSGTRVGEGEPNYFPINHLFSFFCFESFFPWFWVEYKLAGGEIKIVMST